jgi:excisionase family DNA binding protein
VLEGPLLTTEQIATTLNMTPYSVRQAMRHGKIPGAVKMGQQWRLPSSAMQAYISSLTGQPLVMGEGMTEARRLALLDMAEQLFGELIDAWAQAKDHAHHIEQLNRKAKDLASVLRDDGKPK